MARSPLARLVRRGLRFAAAAHRSGLSVTDWIDRAHEARFRADRRAFLSSGVGLAAGLGLASVPLVGCGGSSVRRTTPRVGIVGAGIAGLHCAWRLERAGVPVRIFDANDRTGGRLLSLRDQFPDGLVAEMGAEYIEAEHGAMRALARDLGVQLDLLSGDGPEAAQPDVFHYGGRALDEDAIGELVAPLIPAIRSVASREETDDFERYDAMSIAEWLDGIDDLDPIGRALVEAACVGDFGLEPDAQSLWNLVWMTDELDPDAPADLIVEGEARYHAHTGTQTFTDRLAESLSAEVETGTRLARVERDADGRVRLSLERGGSTVEATFDEVVLALPFNQLRKVDLAVELPAPKRRVIDTLGVGTNAKLVLGFEERVWRTRHGQSGSISTDVGELQAVWDTGRGVASPRGVLTNFVGGARGVAIGAGDAESRAGEVLPWIEQVVPGAAAAYEAGSAVRMHWPSAPFFEGSYACYRPGQAAFSGIEGTPVGNLHFCGEHASVEYQGLMEGAVETGAAVAARILGDAGIGSAGAQLVAWGVPRGRRLAAFGRRG